MPGGRVELQARTSWELERRERREIIPRPPTPRRSPLPATEELATAATGSSCAQLVPGGWAGALRGERPVGRARAGAAFGAGRPGRQRWGEEHQPRPWAAGRMETLDPGGRSSSALFHFMKLLTVPRLKAASSLLGRKLRPRIYGGSLKESRGWGGQTAALELGCGPRAQ